MSSNLEDRHILFGSFIQIFIRLALKPMQKAIIFFKQPYIYAFAEKCIFIEFYIIRLAINCSKTIR